MPICASVIRQQLRERTPARVGEPATLEEALPASGHVSSQIALLMLLNHAPSDK
jgi:hypothetical protein